MNRNGELIIYPFVLIIAFVLLFGFVMAGLAQYAQSGAMSQGLNLDESRPFGLMNYTTVEADEEDDRYVSIPGGGEGYLVSDDDVIDEICYPTHEDPFTFWEEGDENEIKYVHIIRNNVRYNPESTDLWEKYLDYVAIRRHSKQGLLGLISWGTMGGEWLNAAVPFSSIMSRFDNSTNVSYPQFRLGNSQDALFVSSHTGPGYGNFTEDLWDNDFYLAYGWSLFRLEETDFWGAISMVLYADVPGVHPLMNWIIHAFTLGTISYVVFSMAIRVWEAVIPF